MTTRTWQRFTPTSRRPPKDPIGAVGGYGNLEKAGHCVFGAGVGLIAASSLVAVLGLMHVSWLGPAPGGRALLLSAAGAVFGLIWALCDRS